MKIFKVILTFLVVLALLILIGQIVNTFLNSSNAMLKVETKNTKTKVFLEGKSLGESPILSRNLRSGDLDLKLESELSGKKVSFQTTVTLSAQNLTAVNYEFGPTKEFSSGDIRTLRFGSGLSVISTSTKAEVFMDGENVGKTPLSLNPTSGIHKLRLEAPGFFSRELEVNVDSSLRLVVQVFLSRNPFENFEKTQDGIISIYNLTSKNAALTSNTESWAAGIFHFQATKKSDFDLIVDQTGKSFYKNKEAFDKKVREGSNIAIGYIGSSWPIVGVAQKVISDLAASIAPEPAPPPAPTATGPQVQISTTPTGFLNVRSGAGSSYNIVTKVYPGEKYPLQGEANGWYKIPSGWVSGQYAKKI